MDHTPSCWKLQENFQFRSINNVLKCSVWVFSSPYVYMCLFTWPWWWNVAWSLNITFSAKPSSSECCCISIQKFTHWVLPSWTRSCSNCSPFDINRRHLRRICHVVSCGTPSSRLALSMVFYGCFPHTFLSPPRSLIILGSFAMHRDTLAFFHVTAWFCSLPAGPTWTWCENLAAETQSVVFLGTQTLKKLSVLSPPPPFWHNSLPWH